MSHPDLDPAALDALRSDLGTPAREGHASGAEEGAAAAPDAPPPPDGAPGLRTRAKHTAREALRPYVGATLDRLAARLHDRVRESVRADLRAEYGPLESQLHAVKTRVDAVEAMLAPIAELARAAERVHVLEVNQELMKAELGAFHDTLGRLGDAIAPAAGLDGVPARFAELRERVNAVDREVRRLRAATSDATTTDAATATAAASATGEAASSGFDYVGFEQRFRGDPAVILAEQERRYADLLLQHQPVVDLGCGRGELLEVLAGRGARVVGVEPDAGMAAEARARGLEVHETGAIEFLSAAEPASFGAITAIHVIEHLDLDTLVAFFELAATRLRAGGVLVVETPNPASLVVLGNSYVMDPTHVWPLHPALVTFLCERAGFRDVRLELHAPAEAYHLPLLPDPPTGTDARTVECVRRVNDAFRRLNDSLYGPQEYAAIATAPPGPVTA